MQSDNLGRVKGGQFQLISEVSNVMHQVFVGSYRHSVDFKFREATVLFGLVQLRL